MGTLRASWRGQPRVPFLNAQVAELVDALVSGTSGAIRGGSSPLLGTIYIADKTRLNGLAVENLPHENRCNRRYLSTAGRPRRIGPTAG